MPQKKRRFNHFSVFSLKFSTNIKQYTNKTIVLLKIIMKNEESWTLYQLELDILTGILDYKCKNVKCLTSKKFKPSCCKNIANMFPTILAQSFSSNVTFLSLKKSIEKLIFKDYFQKKILEMRRCICIHFCKKNIKNQA